MDSHGECGLTATKGRGDTCALNMHGWEPLLLPGGCCGVIPACVAARHRRLTTGHGDADASCHGLWSAPGRVTLPGDWGSVAAGTPILPGRRRSRTATSSRCFRRASTGTHVVLPFARWMGCSRFSSDLLCPRRVRGSGLTLLRHRIAGVQLRNSCPNSWRLTPVRCINLS
jgi:hypothetical protein